MNRKDNHMTLKKWGFFLLISLFAALNIYSQNIKTLGEIQILGLKKTKERVVLHALNLDSGQEISEIDLPELKQLIENLNHFMNIKLHLKESGNNRVDLIVELEDLWSLYGCPVPSYNSLSGFDLTLMAADGNLTGNLDEGELGVSLGYDPKHGTFKNSVTSADFYIYYDISYMPGFEDWGISIEFNPGWYRTRVKDDSVDLEYFSEETYVSAGISASYYFSRKLSTSISLHTEFSRPNNIVMNDGYIVPEKAFTIDPGVGISYNRLNYLQAGRFQEGWEAAFSDTISFNTLNGKVSNISTLSGLFAVRPIPQINILGSVRIMNSINEVMILGGSATGLRGLDWNAVQTNNAIMINNENRFFILHDLLWGRFSFAVFEDCCISIPFLDFSKSELFLGAGIGIRYSPNFIGGITFVLDVGYNLQDLSKSPEISFSFSEML